MDWCQLETDQLQLGENQTDLSRQGQYLLGRFWAGQYQQGQSQQGESQQGQQNCWDQSQLDQILLGQCQWIQCQLVSSPMSAGLNNIVWQAVSGKLPASQIQVGFSSTCYHGCSGGVQPVMPTPLGPASPIPSGRRGRIYGIRLCWWIPLSSRA